MKITRVDIDAFGCLSDFSLALAPGLHVFYGPNEAGKSTLRRALLAVLYGFYVGDTVKRRETALHEIDKPWSDIRYAAQLEYRLQDGREFRIHRDFSSTDIPTAVWDLHIGKDITDEFGRGRRGNVPVMLKHLGMPKSVFETCAVVSHHELFEIVGENRASPQEIGDTIVSLADTGRRDLSARAAIERLEKVLKEQVGTDRARTTALPVARNKLAEAQAEIDQIRAVQEEIALDAAELQRARSESRRLAEEVVRTRYLVAVVEAAEIDRRIAGIRELDVQQETFRKTLAELSAYAAFPLEDRDRVLQINTRVGEMRKRLRDRTAEIEALRTRLPEIEREREPIVRRLEELSHLEPYAAADKGLVERLLRAWRNAQTREQESRVRLQAAAAEARDLVREYEMLEREVGWIRASDHQRLVAQLRGDGEPTPGVVTAALKIALIVLFALPRLLVWFVSRLLGKPGATSHSVAASVLQENAAELLAKHSRFQEIAPAVRKLRQEEEATAAAIRSSEGAAEALRQALRAHIEDVFDIEVACALFARRVAQAAELPALRSRLQALDAQRTAAASAIRDHEAESDQAAALEKGLREEIEAVLPPASSLDELVEAFDAACRSKKGYDKANRSLAEADERRGMLLGRWSLPELEQMLANRRTDEAAMIAAHPYLEGAQTDEKPQALRDALATLQDEAKAAEVLIAELKTGIDSRLRGLRSRAEVEEEIERWTREVQSLDRFGRALAIAIEVAKQAMLEAHRDFSPRVGGLLSGGLERVTDGRYLKAYLDPSTFRVTTEVPETGQIEDVESLSEGTRAAAYLLLRVGLAQHMSALAEPVPLILDDPLVDLDGMRLGKFLDLLAGLSRDVQILLFTKDPATQAWFAENLSGAPEHALTEMQGTGARAGM